MNEWMDRYGVLLSAALLSSLVASMLFVVTRRDRSSLSHFSRVVGYGWCIAVMVIATIATALTRP